ncbi:MAG: acetyl-CoA carboxylase biotin carboxylase subunit [Planctomycetes bacterium]|nr:acetyl-CoA carboxylase biotin carboxylase subunit [Planctomycetota bacterium]
MFNRILIANRGEIALRVIRACREMGIETVAVYSTADRHAVYLRRADEAICIGPPPASESYLNIPRILSAAEITDVEAIHPGYGFLAENADFAQICNESSIRFIGPSPGAMRRLGDKISARRLAIENDVPVSPGSDGPVGDDRAALEVARKIGYPVMIKASAGGGGRGMRVAHNDVSLVSGIMTARAEARASFKNDEVYLERKVVGARHIEVQILGDEEGNLIHLGERDCSLQRRHQKLIEEAPSPGIHDKVRRQLGEAALRMARAAGYTNAGTVEFLVAPDEQFYFLEVNARIQVEHPVTEMTTGVDIVKEQIRIAAGEPLRYRQDDVKCRGAAIECRINAEDPEHGFRPSPGRITAYYQPGGNNIRVDSHVCAGYEVPPFYDSLIGKIIVHRPTRSQVVSTMRRALEEYVIEGIQTTIPLYLNLFNDTRYIRGDVDIEFLERHF